MKNYKLDILPDDFHHLWTILCKNDIIIKNNQINAIYIMILY